MNFEVKIIEWIQKGRTPFMDYFLTGYSYLATVYSILVLGLVLFLCKKRWEAVGLVGTAGFTYLVCYVIKEVVARPRPYTNNPSIIGIFNADGLSFPSGHSMCSMIIICCLLFFFWNKFSKNQKVVSILMSIMFLLLMGFDRMYLGQHYLTDVLAGFALGFAGCVVGYFVRKPVKKLMEWFLIKFKLMKPTQTASCDAKGGKSE